MGPVLNDRAKLFTLLTALSAPCCGLFPDVARGADDPAQPIAAAQDRMARLRFAPMWIPVPKFPLEAGDSVPSAAYALIWQPAWQKELALSAEQQTSLQAIKTRALADAEQRAEQFRRMSPAEQQAQAKAWEAKRDQFDKEIARQIVAVLTPRQLQTLKDYSYPEQVVGLLYDSKIRGEIGFSPDQETRFRRTVKDKLAKSQEESLKRADKVWALLTPRQQAELPELVMQQGPTSSALSIAYDLGFDVDAMGFCYPMLTEPPVRERLKLTAEQAKQIQAAIASAAEKSRQRLAGGPPPAADAEDKRQVEALLTPQQQAALDEMDFRRRVVLAINDPRSRDTIGMTDVQRADLERLNQDVHARLFRIDREMLSKALEILSTPQQDKLRAEIQRRLPG